MKKSIVVGIFVGLLLFSVGSRIVPTLTCADGSKSSSYGRQGACSHHGGVRGTFTGFFMLLGCIFLGYKSYQLIEKRERKKAEEEEKRHLPFEYGDLKKYEETLRLNGVDEEQIIKQLEKYRN